MRRPYTEREQWFIDRIGKVVYRNDTKCNDGECKICLHVFEHGLLIDDLMHALYVAEIEYLYNADGFPLLYADTKEEIVEFLKNKRSLSSTD